MNDVEYFRSAAGSASSMARIMEMSWHLRSFELVRMKKLCGELVQALDVHKTFVWN